jgi:hypothetical protein
MSDNAWKQRIQREEKALHAHVLNFLRMETGHIRTINNNTPTVLHEMDSRMERLETDLQMEKDAREQMVRDMQEIKDLIVDLRSPKKRQFHQSSSIRKTHAKCL